ncbi:bifunctional adenosylcobinamide kinase/adenosylcobinamide-phosphate guanylyltransferase [uncultured Tateyamaria sp.]|uniref:bifunctional adenosylcobinamide kinase/adenosylcobinamide-phosphate guanylyltransferase n=1 Tax=uncultured Tateyamaria sp. TaxID=455651 RepID=UPI00260FE106|nr:bifunctional adenosylcobinamide kinase/adenosylcobinamide-phosphate guanylyltransferase [uncultured Tateyamaria sp.]
MLSGLTFVLGGAASGKSKYAETVIENSGLGKIYVATARIWDEEIQAKVDLHQARRGADWTCLDAPIDVAGALGSTSAKQATLLDCATMWLTNVMLDNHDLAAEQDRFLTALARSKGPVVVVSNEVGQGIVPDTPLGRAFREAQGRLNIALAAQADCVVHVVAGLPQVIKGVAP